VEVSLNTVNDSDREIEISLTQEEVAPQIDEAYKKASSALEIRGFRKGKAPLSLIKRMYGDIIENDAIDEIANEWFKKAIDEREIKPIGTPLMVDLKYKRGEPLSFKVKFEIKPIFELKEYKGIEVEKPIHVVGDNEVMEEVRRLQHVHATNEPVQKVDGAEYMVTANMQELDKEGAPLSGRKRDGMKVYLDEPSTEPEVKAALKNAEVGGVYTASFEHTHEDHAHSVTMQFTVTDIDKVVLPEFNDEFVKKITAGKSENAEIFKTSIKTDLQKYYDERSGKHVIEAITNEIVRRHEFAVPQTIVQGIVDSYLEEIKKEQPNKEFPRGFDTKRYAESVRPSALWQAKWLLIREQIIAKEELKSEEADLVALAEESAARFNMEKERLLEYYKTSESTTEQIITNKLSALLLQHAKVKDVVTDDPAKLGDAGSY
jgi:trigger factor